MKSRYSILLGMGIVIGLFILVNLVIWDIANLPTDIFLVILLVGGYMATYTSNIRKSRVALISGMGVSILLIIYQLFINKIVSSVSVNLISFVIIFAFSLDIPF